MLKPNIRISSSPVDDSIHVELNPKKEKAKDYIEEVQNEIDVLRLHLRNGKDQKRYFDMTLDEACEIAQVLTTAVGIYLMNCSKEYKREVVDKKAKLTKQIKNERCRKSRKK